MRNKRWCTPEQAAHRLGVPVGTVHRLLRCGVLSSGRKGRFVTVEVADVEAYAGRRRGCGIR